MSYAIDANGVELIASFEGFIDGVYNDSRGFATCGYGHLLHESSATAQDHRAYDGRGRAFFLGLLHQDIARVAIGPMNRYLRPGLLNQHQVNAVASACFNCGPGFVEGTVGRLINQRRFRQAADAFLLWAHPAELLGRRQQERGLFLAPVPHKRVPLPWCTPTERRWCVELDGLRRRRADSQRQRVLCRVMHGEALKIAYAAKHQGGWEKAHRRQRYHSLIARCG